MKGDSIIGDGFTIDRINIRGWLCHVYTSYDPPFVTAHAADDSSIRVFVDFEAEFGLGWQDRDDVNRMFVRAGQIACTQLGELLEQGMQKRRRKWRRGY